VVPFSSNKKVHFPNPFPFIIEQNIGTTNYRSIACIYKTVTAIALAGRIFLFNLSEAYFIASSHGKEHFLSNCYLMVKNL